MVVSTCRGASSRYPSACGDQPTLASRSAATEDQGSQQGFHGRISPSTCFDKFHASGWRSFRSADAMVDCSRKRGCRRAGVSVVPSAFAIRHDRRSASDLSIACHSRSSNSICRYSRRPFSGRAASWRQVRDLLHCGLPSHDNLLSFLANCIGWRASGATCSSGGMKECTGPNLLAGDGRRRSSPAPESTG
jgi:hypothetical protein